MNASIPCPWPPGTALARKAIRAIMDIILHIGAHRTATTSFQQYLRDNMGALQAQDIGFWGPRRMRKGLFSGLYPRPAAAKGRNLQRRAEGRVQMHAELACRGGIKQLIVSEENMMGAPRECLRRKTLYPAIGERMARVAQAFDGRITRVVMSVRAQDLWWSSIAAYAVNRGHQMPGALTLDKIAENRRGWRDVITDLACAVPGADILVLPFEQYGGRPDAVLAHATGHAAPMDRNNHWLNRSPDLAELRKKLAVVGKDEGVMPQGDGRWNPFTKDQAAALREAYADDMMWLTAGADGLATLTEDDTRKRAGTSLPAGVLTKGHYHDQRQGHLARSG